MNVRLFIEDVFRNRLESLGTSVPEDRLKQILRTFDLDAVQDYIDRDIRKKKDEVSGVYEKYWAITNAESHHKLKLKKITEQWTVYYIKESRRRTIMLDEDFKEITASMKLNALSCDVYPCMKF